MGRSASGGSKEHCLTARPARSGEQSPALAYDTNSPFNPIGTEEEWYLNREEDEFDVAAAQAVARATVLVKECATEVKPTENGRPKAGPRLG